MNFFIKLNNLHKILFSFIFLHALFWTLSPNFLRDTLPLDAMEGTTWGHQLEWGYDKNPFMNGWLVYFAMHLAHHADWILYFMSQLSVVICFIATWLLAKKMVSPLYAVLSIFILEGIQYYQLHAIDFSDNTVELSFWALTILFFYNAITQQKWHDWLATGLFAAFAMMTKYYSALLLFSMFLFIIADSTARKSFKNRAFYLALLLMVIIVAPHCAWLTQHDYITIHYAFHRVESTPTAWNHLYFPSLFAIQQFEAFLPGLLLFLIFFIGKKPFFNIENTDQVISSHFNKRFLLFIGLGPFLATLLLSMAFGIHLRAGWGQPLLSLWGLMLFMWMPPLITRAKFTRFLSGFILLCMTFAVGYIVALSHPDTVSTANFPGKEMASYITHAWHERYGSSLAYVAGERWIAGNISHYSPDSPAVYMDWNHAESPWIDEKKLMKKGAIFIWNISDWNSHDLHEQMIFSRFKQLEKPVMKAFYLRRDPSKKPIIILFAFLPPAKNTAMTAPLASDQPRS